MIAIDFRTIFLNYLFTNIVSLIVIIILWQQSKNRFKGTIYLVFDFILQTLAMFLILLRGQISDFLSYDVSNTFAITGALLCLIGLEFFTGRRSKLFFNVLLIVVFFVIHTYFTFIDPNLKLRNLNISVAYLIICFQCAWLLLKKVSPDLRRISLNVSIAFILFCLVNIIRIIELIVYKDVVNDYFQSNNFEKFVIIAYQLISIFLTFSLVLMINRRLLKDIALQEEKYSKSFKSAPFALAITRNTDGLILEVNEGFEAMTNYSSSEIIGKTVSELNMWAEEENRKIFSDATSKEIKIKSFETQLRKQSGEIFTGLIINESIIINNEKCLLSVISDISERKLSDEKIKKANRLYAVISQVNQAIVHNHTRDTLFTEICRVAIDFGKFRMAWIGLVEETTNLVKPVAIAGYDDGYLSQIRKITTLNKPEGLGPTGTAIRNNNYIICNDIAIDPFMTPWKEDAKKHDYRSAIALPIRLYGKPIGAFTIYSDQPNYFNDDEVKLLEEVSFDISYAIDAIETNNEHQKTEKALIESESKFRSLVNQMQYGLAVHEIILDEKGNPIDYRFLDINPSYERITGIKKENAIGKTVLNILPDTEKIWIEKYGHVAITGEPITFESYSQELKMHFSVLAYQPKELQFAVIIENISQRKEIENSLKESEERFRLLVQSAPVGIAIVDKLQNIIFISDKFVEIFGYTQIELPSVNDWWPLAYPDPDYQKYCIDSWNKTIEESDYFQNETKPLETIVNCKDGSRKNIEFRLASNGNLFYVILTDITWRKQIETALSQSELKFRSIVNSTMEAIFIYDPINGQIVDCNLAALNMYGYTKEEFFSLKVKDISSLDDNFSREIVFEKMQIAMVKGEVTFEWKGKRKNMEEFWTEVSLKKAVINDDEQIIAVVRDIEERKKLLETIWESELRHRQMFETSQESIVIIQDSRIVYFNPKLIELTGYSAEETSNMDFTKFIHADDRERVKIDYQESISGKTIETHNQFRVLRKNGSIRWVTISGSNLNWNGQSAGFYFLSDISELKLAEHHANERMKELNAFYRLAELTEQKNTSLDQLYKEFANNLPYSWQYPEITFARIVIGNKEYKTDNYRTNCKWVQKADIILNENDSGLVEIGYLEERPDEYEGPFMKEERLLIDGIAERLSRITERKQAEEKLRISEEKYRLITENASDVIWIVNFTLGKFTYISPAISSLRGLTVDEAMSETLAQSMTAESMLKINRAIEENIPRFIKDPNQDDYYIVEIQQPCKNGLIIWVEVSAKLRYNSQGEIEIIGVSRNIEERKKLEKQIKNNEQKFRLLFENSPLGIYIANTDGTIIDGNNALLTILGSPSLEYTKQINVLKFPPLIENGYADLFLKCIKENKICIAEIPYKTKWGKQIYLSNYLVPLTNSSGNVESIYTLMEDISKRKQAEEELITKETKLKALVDTKDKFFSIIAHDLRSPFTTLVSFTEIMADENSKFSNEEYLQYSRAINKTAQSTFNLLENLLEWSRIQRGTIKFNPTSINLKSLLLAETDETIIETARKKSVQLEIESPEEIEIFADHEMLHTVLRNLVTNAIKFTKPGGFVKVTAIKTGSDEILFSVQDTGIGMDAEMIQSLFRIDANISRPGTNGEPSTGLGLILCKEFVDKHGGKIWAKSDLMSNQKDKGSTFYFTIPLSKVE